MMTAVNRLVLVSGALMSLVCAAPSAIAQPLLPSLPGEGTPNAAPPPAVDGPTPQELYERVRRGIVAIQHNGVPTAVGTVLSGDGRILTALSGLAGAPGADVRYADGTTVHANVERSDKALDLALLAPEPNRWRDGLSASEAEPSGLAIRAMLPARGANVAPASASLKGRTEAHGRGGEPLMQMFDVDVQGPPIAGAPLLDATGAVVAVLVRACKGAPGSEVADAFKKACKPVVVGAPVAAIRTFLAPLVGAAAAPSTPAPATPPAPWLGVRVEPDTQGSVHGVRVAAVAPASPAEQAGLKPGTDVLVAADGQPLASADALAQVISKHVPGDTAKLLVFGGGRFREVSVVLREAH
jgi:serine protease Do